MPASRDAAVLYVTHPSFSQHQTGPFHPERTARSARRRARGSRGRPPDPHAEPAAGEPGPVGVRPCARLSGRGREVLSSGGRTPRSRYGCGADSWEAALRAAGSGPAAVEEISASDDLRIGISGFEAARPSRHIQPGHGVLPHQQHRRHCGLAGFAGCAGGDRRLGRPSRERHPGDVLRRVQRAVCQHPPVPVLSLRGSGRGSG